MAYRPAHPAAYVVRHAARAKVVVPAVDAPGVFFGPTGDGGHVAELRRLNRSRAAAG